MAIGRLVTAVGRCGNCKFNALRAFASFAGVSLPPPSNHIIHPSNVASTRKSFTTSLSYLSETSHPGSFQESAAGEAVGASEKETLESASQHGDSTLPWYLQVAGPPRQESPLSARQQLPPIPDDSPELLKPFLEHLSENIGLDDLVLLDLRILDPPPALGANLMMVIGTARSERHLHVSADRFCRWLRTNYKLSPYADGLLGRNELKLKMRRKARRIKLLSNVGSMDDKNIDDGIRTGWVCINVGSIEPGEQELEDVDVSHGFVGFGGSNNGVRLVVQMMTEEKREEMDLETLWGGHVARQQRKEAREAKNDTEIIPEPPEQVGDALPNIRSHADASPLVLSPIRETIRFSATQYRGFHTAATRCNIATPPASRPRLRRRFSNIHSYNVSHNQPEVVKPELDRMGVADSYMVGITLNKQSPYNREHNYSIYESDIEPQIKPTSEQDAPSTSSTTIAMAEEEIEVALTGLIKHLDRLPQEDAQRVLGQGPDDESSTSFLQTYHQLVQRLQNLQQGQSRLIPQERMLARDRPDYYRALLFGRGVARHHPAYSKESLLEHLRNLQMSGSTIRTLTYIEYIKGFAVPDDVINLAASEATSVEEGADPQTQQIITRESLNMILEVLEDMHLRGINLAHKDILPTLCLALARAQFFQYQASQPHAQRDQLYQRDTNLLDIQPDAVHKITQIMFRHRIPVISIPFYEELLEIFANVENWTAYWQCWRGLARRSQSRPFKLYQNLFRHMASTGSQRMCLDALREWIPEMEREDPPVVLQGDEVLVYEITRCLRIADPRSERLAAQGEKLGEWFRLWQRLSDASQPTSDPQHDVSPDVQPRKPRFYSPSLEKYRFENRVHEEEEEQSLSQQYALKT